MKQKKIEVYDQNKTVLKSVDIRFSVTQDGESYKFNKSENSYVRINTKSSDIAIPKTNANGEFDASKFFDFTTISDFIRSGK